MGGEGIKEIVHQASAPHSVDIEEEKVLEDFHIGDVIQFTSKSGFEHLITECGSMQCHHREMRITEVGGHPRMVGRVHVVAMANQNVHGWIFPHKSIGKRMTCHRKDSND